MKREGGEETAASETGEKGAGLKKGPWTAAEDAILIEYVKRHGEGNWNSVQRNTGLSRCGKSCRLRWANHLRPNLKKGSFSPEEELLIARLHAQLGNKWARMAAQLPGRTDNEIKNYWNTRLKRRQRAGLPIYPSDVQLQLSHKRRFVSSGPPSPNTPPLASDPSTQFNPFTFSAPASPMSLPWVKQLSFQFHSSPASPTTPTRMQYNLGNYDISPPPMLPLSVKPELPSTQFSPAPIGSGGSGNDAGGLLVANSTGLLDAMLQDVQDGKLSQLSEEGGSKSEFALLSQGSVPGLESKLGGLESYNGIKMKIEARNEINPVREDGGTLFDMIPEPAMPEPVPTSAVVPDWYNSDSGDMSNGQSSAMTDDDLGLQMHQLASILSTTPVEDWNIRACR
ncbi:uncharacterized protein [Typha angustifolia]|uniref:uncharacterized protein n=1 Tax=Typha angustifolia TaxID=59011 RepID=UPI003C2AAEE7